MNIVQEKIDELNAIAKIEVKREDYEPKLNAALKEHSSKMDLKGFRKGKVPIHLVKKMYGKSVLLEELNKIVNEELNNFLKEEKIEILGYPIPKEEQNIDFNINQLADYEFIYELGLVPEFKVELIDENKSFEKIEVEVGDKETDTEIENLLLRHGDVVHPDDIQMKDIVSIEFIELDEEGNPKENGINHNAAITTDMALEDFQQKLFSSKKEDQFNYDITKIYDRQKADFLKNVLEYSENEDYVNNNFQLKVLNVNRMEKATINDDFFSKAFPNGDVTTEEGLRTHLKDQMESYLNSQAQVKFENDLFDKLVTETNIPLPNEFLKRWIKVSNEKPITDEQIDQDFDKVVRDIKWSLIENKLSQEYNIEISADEIKEETRIQLQQQMAQYGIGSLDEERTEEFVKSMMSKEDHIRQTAGRIMQKKLFGTIQDKVDIVTKKVNLDTFKELIAPQN